MARVTVEDCVRKVPNRFELIMVAAQRARKIGSGAPLTIERDNDKNPVVSLREIAGETVSIDDLKEELIRNNQRVLAFDDEDDGEENIELMDGEAEWGAMAEKASAAPAAEGLYADEEFVPEDDAGTMAEKDAPSLEDLAGSASS